MSREGISIAANQEIKPNRSSDHLSCAGYNTIHKDHERENGGALAFNLHNTVQYHLIDGDIDYRPNCLIGYHLNIDALLRSKSRFVLDFNAYHNLWSSTLSNDHRGMELAKQINDSPFCTMNDEAVPRIIGTCNSSPEIAIANGGLINSISWRPMLTLVSYHILRILLICP